MKLATVFSALLVPGLALAGLLPSAVPGSELEAGMGDVQKRTAATTACNANNCARAVTGTNARAPLATRQADCSSFMRETLLFPTTTVTLHNLRRQQTIFPNSIPTYASACDNVSKYSSACSCWGITATTTTVQPTATVTPKTLTGVLRVDAGGATLGYITTDPNYWTPLLQPLAANALVVTFEVPDGATSVSGVEFNASPNHGYPLFGLISGRDSTDGYESPGSFNYLYLTPTTHTPSGSTPQAVPGFFNDATGLGKGSESSVWNVNIASGAVTPTWINPDGNPAVNLQVFVQSNHVYGGSDPGAFHSRFPAPVTVVTLTFVPI